MRKNKVFVCSTFLPFPAQEVAIPVSISCHRCGNDQTVLRECTGIVDTGATSTMISEKIAKELELIPSGTVSIAGVHGTKKANQYRINIDLGGYVLQDHPVSGASGNAGFDLLIGMDILSMGDLHLVKRHGNTLFRFAIPFTDNKGLFGSPFFE